MRYMANTAAPPYAAAVLHFCKKNYFMLDGGPDAPNFEGVRAAPCKVQGRPAISCVQTAEPIEMPFGLWTLVRPMKHMLDGGPDPPAKGQFSGERTCPGMPDDTLP